MTNSMPKKMTPAEWRKIIPSIVEQFAELEIHHCQLRYENCMDKRDDLMPIYSFAHSKHRNYIFTEQDRREVIKTCNHCHAKIDADSHETTEVEVKRIRERDGIQDYELEIK